MRGTLVIMVKAPAMGRVKTRLAREIGAVEALRFYRTNTAALLRRVGRDPRWRTLLAVDPPSAITGRFWPAALPRRPQAKGDIGARMLDQLRGAPSGPVLLIGSDIPGIAARHVAAGFSALRSADIVFGPAEDGGFWLVGLRAGMRPSNLFRSVRWSGPHALADTLAGLDGLRVARIATLFDVDDAGDWRRWKRLAVHGKAG